MSEDCNKYEIPYLPKLWARHAAVCMDLRLANIVRREIIPVAADERHVCNFPFGVKASVEHIYEVQDFSIRNYDQYDVVRSMVIPMADRLADRIIERAGCGGVMVSYQMPLRNVHVPSAGILSQNACEDWADFALYSTLFIATGAVSPDIRTFVLEMMVAFHPRMRL